MVTKKDMFKPSVYGVGYIGEGDYSTRYNGEKAKEYEVWRGILRRCYSPKSTSYLRYGSRGVVVCNEWHNFQNFAGWFCDNYRDGYQLDKDILIRDSKIYSPDTCRFVPQHINKLLITCNKSRGVYPVGVYFYKGKYKADIQQYGERIYLGYYNTPEEAFAVYKQHKEAHIKVVATEAYEKGEISLDVCEALMQYTVIPYPE